MLPQLNNVVILFQILPNGSWVSLGKLFNWKELLKEFVYSHMFLTLNMAKSQPPMQIQIEYILKI